MIFGIGVLLFFVGLDQEVKREVFDVMQVVNFVS
jgi:hypothetical protein